MNSSPIENSHKCKPKTVSNPRKQIEKVSQNNKKFIKDITREEFRVIK